MEFEPGTAGSEITELPLSHEAPDVVQLIEKAICLWFLCPMMDLGTRRCLQVPTRRTAPENVAKKDGRHDIVFTGMTPIEEEFFFFYFEIETYFKAKVVFQVEEIKI